MEERRICKMCGREFMATRRINGKWARYCSPECQKDAEIARARMSHNEAHEREVARRGMRQVETGRLDKSLNECRERGLTYAELQIERTKKMLKRKEIEKMKQYILEREFNGEWYYYASFGEGAIEELVRTGAYILNGGQEIRIRIEGGSDGE